MVDERPGYPNQSELQSKLARFAMDNASIEIYWLDRDARICYANNHACKTLGYSREEFLQLSLSDLDPNYPITIWHEHWEDLKRDKTQSFETSHKRKNGEIFPVDVVANYVCFDGQEYNVGFAIDISERKQIQRKSEMMLQCHYALMRSALEGIHIMDMQGNVVEANDTFCHMLGYTQQEMSKLNVSDWNAQWSQEELTERFGKVVQIRNVFFETKHRRKDGHIVDVEVSSTGIEIGGQNYIFASSRDITKRKADEERMHNLAFYDALTRLPNRHLLEDRLEQAIAACKRSNRYGAVMFLDLDNFKPLNDTHGHKAGDLLLVEVARRLKSCVREVDTVARFGGDEFVVVLSELDGGESDCISQSQIVADKIHDVLAEPYWLASNFKGAAKMIVHPNVGASIGVSLFANNANAENILRWADMAMYQAKKAGRNQIQFHEETA